MTRAALLPDVETTAVDRVAALHAQLTERLATLTTSDEWVAYLRAAARFQTYSANNVLLILMQRPDAQRVAGFHTWKALGRSVVKGAKGIKILAPCSYKVRDRDGAAVVDESGNELRRLRGFRVAHVFDVEDTAGDPLPVVVATELVEGDAPSDLWDALGAQVNRAGFTLTRGDCGGANGLTDFGARIVCVRDGLSNAQAAKTLAHELTHAILHDGLIGLPREREELEGQLLRISSSRQLRLMLASGEASGVMLFTAQKQAVGEEDMEKSLPLDPVSPCLLNLIITAFVHRTIHNGKEQLSGCRPRRTCRRSR